ncbi:MAG: GNAT family N-acetyltransferase [Longimicrobiales bacterium]
MPQSAVTRNESEQRFEAPTDHGLAVLDYRMDGEDTVAFTHTLVPEAARHHGIGSALAKAALDWARESGLNVVPRCPFVKDWIEHNPAYQELVAS